MVLQVVGDDGGGEQKMDRKMLDAACQLKFDISVNCLFISKFFLYIRQWSQGVIH
jgi:hypothetical protein